MRGPRSSIRGRHTLSKAIDLQKMRHIDRLLGVSIRDMVFHKLVKSKSNIWFGYFVSTMWNMPY